ncbi:hypothetical protein F5Y19DRAFT_319047 [Xylariaceae sp. FL1651]|nr:hypothetical protein F5Y19DRAFT_319047 [Xylariaceae sp. FL1651]
MKMEAAMIINSCPTLITSGFMLRSYASTYLDASYLIRLVLLALRGDGYEACLELLSLIIEKILKTRSFTYDHRIWRTRGPVRSPIAKPDTARLVVGSVTTSESLVLYVFFFSSPSVGRRRANLELARLYV